ncbi:MAG: translocation/assembly module TamB domain-containing protein, partial [Candidatus Krumholzibacteriota bacterium]|nr:translocation/assembly module TamB domain-containing protein [Candidatus Krumholzibacteriota bacterium]
STRGEITDVISASLEIDSLAGVLRDLNVSGRGSVTVQGDRIAVDSLVVGWGANQLRLAGVYDNQVDLRVRVVIPDLADVMPDAGGSVYIDGRLRGSRDAPAIEARVRIDSVRVGEYRGDYFAADVELDLTDGGTVAADVRAQGIEAAGQIIDSVTVVASGSTMAHEVTVGVGAQGKTLGITLLGSWDDEVWAGTLDRLDVGLGIFDNWSLAALAPIEASPVHIRIDPVRLVSSGSMITMAGYWSAGDSIRVSLDVDSLAYARADTLLPTGVSVTGWIDLALDAAVSPGGEVVANLSVVSSPGRISWQDGQTPRAIEFDSTFVTGGVDSSGAFAYLGARIHREGEVITNISGSFHMPEVHNFERMPDEPQFTARLRALFADLSFIALLSRDIGATGGRLEADAGFEGTLLDPQFMGTIALTGGMIDFIPLGLNVRDVEFTASGSRGQGLVLNGSMRSGGGTLEMTTELGREESSVHIRGQNFAVSNTAEARVRISPEIGMMLKDGQFNLEGEVRVPFARIEVFQAPQSAVGVSRDVVIVGADSTAGKALDVHADLRVVLAEDSVTFRGFGFNGEIQGSMLVSERPGRPTTASGELKIVKGTYDAYGQLLTIDPGRIRYAGGPIDNPGFDIRAFREITEHSVIAGVLVRGTARRPQVTIFSEPAMSQNEALSYMLTGQPLTSDNQRDMMAAAALSMGMAQGNAAMQGIGREVGLDDVRFETGGTLEEASFVAGKYLSPQLYISNTMGLFDRVSTWRVRYFISKKWTLQAESGKTTGSDLFYRIERGK